MLSARIVRAIEDHAEDLTRGVLQEIARDPRTPAYHHLAHDDMKARVYDVYHHLGRWLGEKKDEEVEQLYLALGRRRHREGIPLSQVVLVLTLIKRHLRDYVMRHAGDSALDLYQEEELHVVLENFFDRAMFHTVRGYEEPRT